MSNFDDLWCDDCGRSHEGLCRKHGVLHKVQDAVIPSRARLTLPPSLSLKMLKENGAVVTGVFAKKNIPVRSQFGPLDAPVISKTKVDPKPKKATTVWKKKHAMQKALETSSGSQHSLNDTSDLNQAVSDNSISPIIPSIKSDQPLTIKGPSSAGAAAEVAISSIQQQLMSITSQSISQTGVGDNLLLSIQGVHQPLHSSPVNGNHANLGYQQALPDLNHINLQSGASGIQLSQENLQQVLQHHYHNFTPNDLNPFQHNISIGDSSQLGGVDHSGTMLQIAPVDTPLTMEGQPGIEPTIMDHSHLNVSDTTDVTSDNELDESSEQLDMSFELKVLTEDGFTEVYSQSEEDHSNWMIFVRPATSVKEQNLIAYQEDGSIYFVSLRPIPPNTELKVWYSKDYAKSISKGMLPTEEKQEDGHLQCLACEVRFPDQEEMEGHQCVGSKFKARRKGRPRKYVKPTKTWRAKLEKSRIKESQNSETKATDKATGTAGDLLETPVKRGRGRPRTKNVVLKQAMPEPHISFIEIPPIEASKQPVEVPVNIHSPVENDARTNKCENESATTYNALVNNETYNPMMEQDNYDDHDDDFEHSLPLDDDDKDPMYADRLIITEEKQKQKRGRKGNREPMHCPHCGEKFVAEAQYYVHIYQHTGVKPFRCEYSDCGRGFLSKFKLERHRLIHTSPRSHKCPYCDKSFNRKDHLKNHMITHDPNKKIWKCELCDKEYCYSFSYRTHMAFHKAESGETLCCLICKKSYDTKEGLLFHLKVHTGARAAKNTTEKTHSCFECNKKFFTRKDVKRHMITHTKRKDYLCQFCPQRFGRKDHLTRHLRTSHSGDSQNATGRVRRSTGDSVSSSPGKRPRERPIYANVEPTMVPLQLPIAVQQDELHEQLINGVNPAAQTGNNSTSQATILQNLQYAMSQIPGRDLQLQAAIFEVAAAAAATGQTQETQQPTQAQMTPINTIQPPPGLPTVHTSVPVQYQINDKGYVMNTQPPEPTVVRQIQLSPNIDYKQLTQQIQQGNMYIAAAAPSTPVQPQQTNQPPQQQQLTPTVQQIPIQLQQPINPQGGTLPQAIIGKLDPSDLARGNIAIMQQPGEYQLSVSTLNPSSQPGTITIEPHRSSNLVVASSAADPKQSPYSTMFGYMETLRFLENLPTNNGNAVPVQQVQTVNLDLGQSQPTQILPAGSYNAIPASANNIININQSDLKGVVAITNQHGTLQLTPQDLKNMVSLAQGATPVQHIAYQQQT